MKILVFPESLSNSLGLTQHRSSAVKWNQIKEASARCCEGSEDGGNAINSVLPGAVCDFRTTPESSLRVRVCLCVEGEVGVGVTSPPPSSCVGHQVVM